MTPLQQETLSALSFELFDLSVRYKIAAKENKSRLEVLKITQDYCKNLSDIYEFIVNQCNDYQLNQKLTEDDFPVITNSEDEEE